MTPEEIKRGNSFENKSGFSHQVMKDLQRIFCCTSVADSASLDPEYVEKICAFQGFGPRVMVTMSASTEWRPDV